MFRESAEESPSPVSLGGRPAWGGPGQESQGGQRPLCGSRWSPPVPSQLSGPLALRRARLGVTEGQGLRPGRAEARLRPVAGIPTGVGAGRAWACSRRESLKTGPRELFLSWLWIWEKPLSERI